MTQHKLGIRDKISAAKELLDRTGLVKTEKMQVESIRWCDAIATKERWIEV